MEGRLLKFISMAKKDVTKSFALDGRHLSHPSATRTKTTPGTGNDWHIPIEPPVECCIASVDARGAMGQ